jgi:hypothetical protein
MFIILTSILGECESEGIAPFFLLGGGIKQVPRP